MTEALYGHLTAEFLGNVLILKIVEPAIQGEDIACLLREEMLTAVTQTGARLVVVDFQNTTYISSVAFWPLLSLHRALHERNGRIVVCGLSPTVGDVFFTTRLVSADGNREAPFGLETDVPTSIARLCEWNDNHRPL